MVDVNDLAWLIGKNLKDVDMKLEAGDNNSQIESQIQIMTTQTPYQVQIQMTPPPLLNT